MYKHLMKSYVTPLAPIPTSIESQTDLKQPVRAVMFDVYGTLFISASGDINLSMAQKNTTSTPTLALLLEKYNIPIPYNRLHDLLMQAIESAHRQRKEQGIAFPEIEIQKIWARLLQTDTPEIARQFSIEYEMIVNPVYPMPNLHETLQRLKNKNIPMGIISNAQFFTPYLFALFYDARPENLWFEPGLIFYSFTYGIAKPSLYLFELAAARLDGMGITPSEVLYVGNDMLNDIYPARKTGFRTCLFAGDQRSLRLRDDIPECRAIHPDTIIKDLKQLADMVVSY